MKRFSSFAFHVATLFLGALNDNVYKMLLVFFLIELEGSEHTHEILANAGAIFVLPFLLLASTAGTLADRFSKNRIIIITKIFELIAIIGGVASFYFESKYGGYFVLLLMAAQTAIFVPSKYGIVPEIVPLERISKANGYITSATFLAIIIGTFLASFITQISDRNYLISSLFCTVIAVIGLITSICVKHTPASGSTKKISIRFVSEIIKTLKFARSVPNILCVICGSAFFLFIGAFVQLNMIPFAIQLGLSDVEGGYLFLLTALGIGIGSLTAGKISGKRVELGLVPIGALGIVICSLALAFFSFYFYLTIVASIVLGFFGGIYQVPLDSFIQVESPDQKRGQIISANSFLSFVGVLCSSFLLYAMDLFELPSNQGFLIIGIFTSLTAIFFLYKFHRELTGMLEKILFKKNKLTERL